MKLKIVIDDKIDEEVVIYAHQKTSLVEKIEKLVTGGEIELVGFKEKEAARLELADVYAFTVEAGKVYAIMESGKFLLKCRLYQLEEQLGENFIKLNQSTIANIKKIERFDASFSGSLMVKFKNNYTDYVSRRQLKTVKERFGLK